MTRWEFDGQCAALARFVQDAADPMSSPYWDTTTKMAAAAWWTRRMVQKARAMGLYPTREQMEREAA
jgi:hypothetical protein